MFSLPFWARRSAAAVRRRSGVGLMNKGCQASDDDDDADDEIGTKYSKQVLSVGIIPAE